MNRQFTIAIQIPDNLLSSRPTLEAMKVFRRIITIVCILASFIANAAEQLTANVKCAANESTNAGLQRLQGTWEGFSLSPEKPDGPPVKGTSTITVTITGNSLHYYGLRRLLHCLRAHTHSSYTPPSNAVLIPLAKWSSSSSRLRTGH
jgi:hypothetical protein